MEGKDHISTLERESLLVRNPVLGEVLLPDLPVQTTGSLATVSLSNNKVEMTKKKKEMMTKRGMKMMSRMIFKMMKDQMKNLLIRHHGMIFIQRRKLDLTPKEKFQYVGPEMAFLIKIDDPINSRPLPVTPFLKEALVPRSKYHIEGKVEVDSAEAVANLQEIGGLEIGDQKVGDK